MRALITSQGARDVTPEQSNCLMQESLWQSAQSAHWKILGSEFSKIEILILYFPKIIASMVVWLIASHYRSVIEVLIMEDITRCALIKWDCSMSTLCEAHVLDRFHRLHTVASLCVGLKPCRIYDICETSNSTLSVHVNVCLSQIKDAYIIRA